MKKINKNATGFFVLWLLLVISSAGCDQISEKIATIQKKFSKDKKKTSAPKPAAVEEVTAKPAMAANTLARVGTWTITIEEFNERLKALKELYPDFDTNNIEAKGLILEELVTQQAVILDAEKKGVTKEKDFIQAFKDLKQRLIVEEMARRATATVVVSTKEARQYYETNKETPIEEVQLHVREIVLESQLRANEILVELLKGYDFAAMAKQYSISESAASGGDLGFITEEPFPRFLDAVLPLEQGDLSSVLKGPEGYYIFKLEEKIGGKQLGQITFEEAEGSIKDLLARGLQEQALIVYINQVKQAVDMEINESLLER